MSAIAGRVLILPKGDYDASVTYEFLDLVNHKSSSWLAKKSSQGIEPSDENSEFWQKFGSSVTPDGVTIVIGENGVISAVGGTAEKVTYENESVADVTNVKEALDAIFDGTQQVGDSEKLGGKDASEWGLTTNLLKPPTNSSTTNSGVTCTYNADGSLTFNGTTTNYEAQFAIAGVNALTLKKGKYKVMLNPSADSDLMLVIGGANNTSGLAGYDVSDSVIIDVPKTGTIGYCLFKVPTNTVMDNITLKPMLTTNLEATVDDFVPYTGSTGKLNGDVVEIRKTYFNPSNKPSGTYTGNGASSRTVTIGIGTSDIIMLREQNTYNFYLVTKSGYGGKLAGSTSWISGEDCYISKGDSLVINNSTRFNKSGSVYEYFTL